MDVYTARIAEPPCGATLGFGVPIDEVVRLAMKAL